MRRVAHVGELAEAHDDGEGQRGEAGPSQCSARNPPPETCHTVRIGTAPAAISVACCDLPTVTVRGAAVDDQNAHEQRPDYLRESSQSVLIALVQPSGRRWAKSGVGFTARRAGGLGRAAGRESRFFGRSRSASSRSAVYMRLISAGAGGAHDAVAGHVDESAGTVDGRPSACCGPQRHEGRLSVPHATATVLA